MKRVFVFGSNLAGVHGAGAARTAYREYGALWGMGYGPSGQTFAIPTKDEKIITMELNVIHGYVLSFLEYADFWREKEFQITRIGCGLAGLQDKDMANMFKGAPDNCYFDTKWIPYLPEGINTWGTF